MSLFVRFPRSFVGHGCPIIRPKVSKQLDYEGEVAIVVSKEGRHIPEAVSYTHLTLPTILLV